MSDIFEFPGGKGPNFPPDLADERAERERKEAEERKAKAEAQSMFEARADAIYQELAGTAGQYGYIWAGQMPKAWKKRAKALFGTSVDEANHLRRSDFFRFGAEDVLFRLTKQQVLMGKLASSDGLSYVIEDPKGAIWMTLLIHRAALGIPHFRIVGPPLIRWMGFSGGVFQGEAELHSELVSSKWTDKL